jgi:hypothetical protein
MKNSIKILLNLSRKVVIREKMLPMSKLSLDRLKKLLPKILILCFDSLVGFQGRLLIANNFLQFIFKMKKNHGSPFTIKWLKACSVSLQKWLGGDKLKSLREIEVNLPLPRLVNGCPAIINRMDRFSMKKGDIRIIRFWHSLFSIYRVLEIPGQLKIKTILDPFNGDEKFLDSLLKEALNTSWPDWIKDVQNKNLAPTTFHITGKASPSNVNSSFGILTDIYLLLSHEDGKIVFDNIMKYLSIVGLKWNTLKFLERINSAKEILLDLPEDSLPIKSSMNSPFGQFATKHEAAGKIRVFALVDSVTQSVMKPLHEAIFLLLRKLPNDGTFDQDAAVVRCSQKAILYNQAYSFDLSAATDRLPVKLTANIFESIVRLSGFGLAWEKVMVERKFTFTSHASKQYNLDPHIGYYYSVGQPMGCLSSWAGLAITHHWIMQYCSRSLGINSVWEDRYEILGDDIVIFDSALANSYTMVMKQLGLEINFSKSLLSKDLPVFEFAKRTVIGKDLVSGISPSQIWSCDRRASLVNNVFQWISRGYLTKVNSILAALNNFKAAERVDLKLSTAVFHLASQSMIERAKLISSIVDPRKGIYFDAETSFEVPVKTLIGMSCDKILSRESSAELSKFDIREEWFDENEELFVASILQSAFNDIKLLSHNHLDTLSEWSKKLVKVDMLTPLQLSQVAGWFEDIIIDEYTKSNDPYELEDEVEKLLIRQAKVRNVKWEDAMLLYQKVKILSFKFKIPDHMKASNNEKFTSANLLSTLNPLLGRGPEYWSQASAQI